MKKLENLLDEDLVFGDVTTQLLVPAGRVVRACVVAGEPGVLAGVEEATQILSLAGIEIISSRGDGETFTGGDKIMVIKGDARKVLMVERTILNLLSRMSGVATISKEFLERAKRVNPRIRIATTRKTMPGLRYYDKKAAQIGGCDTHRFSLGDGVLIKDNHIKIVGSVRMCVEKLKRASFVRKIEIEVETPEQALEAAKAGADIIMLDNMSPETIVKTLSMLEGEKLREKVLVEASGGITLDNLEDYAATGVDIISIGMLTKSAKWLDFSLEVEPPGDK